jgi:Bacterial Ig-like domain (group 2)/Leishmanolysin/Bacterial Ig-like domain (group 1)
MRVSRWTLGCTLLLLTSLQLAGCGGGVEPKVPTLAELSAGTVTLTAIGQTQQLTATVTDQDGARITSPSLTWTSTNTAVAAVDASGLVTAVGNGAAKITATAGSASASADVTVAQAPAQLEKAGGDQQTSTVGQAMPLPLSVRVLDANAVGISGAIVTFTASSSGGTAGTPSATTGADGIASTTFTVLTSGAVQVTAAVSTTSLATTFTETGVSPFAIELQFLTTPTDAQRQAFVAARDHWQRLITSEVPNVSLSAAAGTCGPESPPVNRTVDDLLILVSLGPIDGAGSVLGASGPCYIRSVSSLPVLGLMKFDTADLDVLESEGLLQTVILHEMAHVLGFGTIWTDLGLLAGPSLDGGTDPHFTGAQARIAFDAVGGAGYGGLKVPVEKTGGSGTADSHWRESVFGSELMTGFVDPNPNPLSRATVASFADLGYTVNLAGADPYTLGAALRAFSRGPRLELGNDVLRIPRHVVDGAGRPVGP